jgi:flagellar assembly factor FliW
MVKRSIEKVERAQILTLCSTKVAHLDLPILDPFHVHDGSKRLDEVGSEQLELVGRSTTLSKCEEEE